MWTLGQPFVSSIAVASFVGPRLVERLVTQQYFFYCWIGFSIWIFFSQGVQMASSSLIQKMKLVRSSTVPRSYLAISPVLAGLLELSLNLLVVFLITMLVLDPVVTYKTPFIFALALFIAGVFSLGVAFWVSSLCLLFQDLKYLVSFLVQLGFLCTPVIYSPRIFGEKSAIYYSNPIALAMKLIRFSIGVSQELVWGEVVGGILIGSVTLISGYLYFKSKADTFAELV